MTIRIVLLIVFMLLSTVRVSAQARFHIIPQVADGSFPDGAYYKTTFMVIPWFDDDSANCSLRLYGLTVTFTSGNTGSAFNLNISAGGFSVLQTTANQPIRTGYATLECDEFVYAQALYSSFHANGTKLAEATVFSSEGDFSTRIIADYREGSRLGVAIANNTDISRTYRIKVGAREATVSIAGRTSLARFLDELISITPNSVVLVEIESTSFSEFGAIGLRYTGGVFTTVPAQ